MFKKIRSRGHRYTIIGANAALLMVAVFFITNNPDSGAAVRHASIANAEKIQASPLDQLSSADIAVNVARITVLPEEAAVTSQADFEATQLAITTTPETKVVAKPQVVTSKLKSARDIRTYITVEGDTVSALAVKFGITSDSIRWSNALTKDKLPAGKELLIPPVSGIVYTVKAGDTVEVLAQRFGVSKEQILADNDAELSGIQAGQRVLIRGGQQQVFRSVVFSGMPSYGSNGYDPGYCTWYVANKRAAAGRPIPNNLGNGGEWGFRARRLGLSVGNQPQAGAAVVTATRGYGHVAYVERVFDDGSILISEMNANWIRYKITSRIIPAGQASTYDYVY